MHDAPQVELIVCIRAEHYRDALMYSQIILEKDPDNMIVMPPPLLRLTLPSHAFLAVPVF